jgi:hypothetical protein
MALELIGICTVSDVAPWRACMKPLAEAPTSVLNLLETFLFFFKSSP